MANLDETFQVSMDKFTQSEDQEYVLMPLTTSLLSEKWKFRKRAYQDLNSLSNPDQTIIDFLNISAKTMFNDRNPASFLELFQVYEDHPEFFVKSSQTIFEVLIDRYPLSVNNLQYRIENISLREEENILEFCLLEILKKIELNLKNPKIVCNLLKFLNALIIQSKTFTHVSSSIIRKSFEKNALLLEHSNIEIRQLASENLQLLYRLIDEDYEIIQNSFLGCKLLKTKQIKELLSETGKAQNRVQICSNEERSKFSKSSEKIDLGSFLPEKFLDIPYKFDPNFKQRKLEEFNSQLICLDSSMQIDFTKDYTQIWNILALSIEEQNYLIYSESMKAVGYILPLFKKNCPFVKLKSIIINLAEKFKPNSTSHNQEINEFFFQILKNECLSLESFIEMVFSHIEGGGAKPNPRTFLLKFMEELLVSDFIKPIRKKKIIQLIEKRIQSIENSKNLKMSKQLKGLSLKLLQIAANEKENMIPETTTNPFKTMKEDNCSSFIRKGNEDFGKTSFFQGEKTEKDEQPETLKSPRMPRQDSFDICLSNKKGGVVDNELDSDQKSIYEAFKKDFDLTIKVLLSKENATNSKNLDNHLQKITDCLNGKEVTGKPLEIILKRVINAAKLVGEKGFDFFVELFIRLNKCCLALNDKNFCLELKGLVLSVSKVLNSTKKIEAFFDSAFRTCEIKDFLEAALQLLKKLDQLKYIYSYEKSLFLLRFFINWLGQKVEKSTLFEFSEKNAKYFLEKFENFTFSTGKTVIANIHKPLLEVLRKKIKDEEQFEIMTISKEFDYNYEEALIKLKVLLGCDIIKKSEIGSSNRHWRRGMGREEMKSVLSSGKKISPNSSNIEFDKIALLIQKVFENFKYNKDINLSELFTFIIDLKNFYPLQIPFLISNFFKHICIFSLKNSKKSLDHFLDTLTDVEDEIILKNFKIELGNLLKKEGSADQFLENLFTWIMVRRLDENIEIIHLPFVAHSLISALSLANLSELAEKLMIKLHQNNKSQSLKIIFENELATHRKLYDVYLDYSSSHQKKEEKKIENLVSQKESMLSIQKLEPNKKDEKKFELFISEIDTQQIINNIEHNNKEEIFNIDKLDSLKNNNGKITTSQEFTNFNFKNIERIEKEMSNLTDFTELNFQTSDTKNRRNNYVDLHSQNIEAHMKLPDLTEIQFQNTDKKSDLLQFSDEKSLNLNNPNNITPKLTSPSPPREPNSELLAQINEELLTAIAEREFHAEKAEKLKAELQVNMKLLDEAKRLNNELSEKIKILENERKTNATLTEKIKILEENERKNEEQLKKIEGLEKIIQKMEREGTYKKEERISFSEEERPIFENSGGFRVENVLKGSLTGHIRKLQEVFLNEDETSLSTAHTLISFYEGLPNLGEKLKLVNDLKLTIINAKFLNMLGPLGHRSLLRLIISLCASDNTQKEIFRPDENRSFCENDLTKELQIILDALLRALSACAVLINLVSVLNMIFPNDLMRALSKMEKMSLRIIVKCIEKIYENILIKTGGQEKNCFKIMLELYRFFKQHPAEDLDENMPSLQDLEQIYKGLKNFADHLIKISSKEAKEFLDFVNYEEENSVFLSYVNRMIENQ